MTIGAVFFGVGALMFLSAIDNMKRESHQFNMPWRWIFLFGGLILSGFGLVLVLLEL